MIQSIAYLDSIETMQNLKKKILIFLLNKLIEEVFNLRKSKICFNV